MAFSTVVDGWSVSVDGWSVSVGDWSGDLGNSWGGVSSVSWLSIGDWSSDLGNGWGIGSVSWLSVGNWGSDLSNGWLSVGKSWLSVGDWGSSDLLDNSSWSRTVNDGVESVDWVGGVGNGTDGTIGLNKGVLSLDDTVGESLGGGLGVTGQTIGNGVSVAVRWVGVNWLSSNDGLGNWLSVGNWSSDLSNGWLSVGNWGSSVGWLSVSKTSWSDNSGAGNSHKGQESGDLSVHDYSNCCWCCLDTGLH
jgi:hypothetical protein